MSEIVLLHHNEPMTTSLALAEGTENTHESVIKLVRKYIEDLQEFGTFGFEIQKSGGRPTEIAYLNEPQATLLITYLRNTEIVRRFKIALVKAFYELRDRLAVPPAPTFETRQLSHGADLAVAADRTFRSFLRSARSAGLRLPAALRMANRQTIARTGMDMLAELGMTAQDVIEPAIEDCGAAAFGDAWLGGDLPLPATICRSAELYAAYAHWRRGLPRLAINRFFDVLARAHPSLSKRTLWAQGDERTFTVKCVVVGHQESVPGNFCRMVAAEIDSFTGALAEWKAASA